MRRLFYFIWVELFFMLMAPGIMEAQNCDPPLIFTGNEITDTSIILRWFSIDLPDEGYQLSVQERGMPPVDSSAIFIASTIERDTIFSLQPQRQYTAYIRSICAGDTSAWKSLNFQTAIRNGIACQLNVGITDNSCLRGGQSIPIIVKDHPGDTLGTNIKLQSIQLIIDHPYPADLSIAIRNPSGSRVQLIENFGSFTDNFGNPSDTNCLQSTEFTLHSCKSIYEGEPPFLGQFHADEHLNALNDGSLANGKWILEICDRAPDDVGILKFIHLNFSQDVCPQAPILYPTRLGDSTQEMNFQNTLADSIRILFSTDSSTPVSAFDPTYRKIDINPIDSTLTLKELDLNTSYYAWSFIFCDGNWSGPSCRNSFTTLKGYIDHYSDWDDETICKVNCQASCILRDQIWQNSGYAWNINQGATPTDETGPEGDVYNPDGLYIYKESSQSICRENESILQSVCLEKSDSNSGIGFYYHMAGTGLGGLHLLLSQDEWSTTDTLWSKIGQQGDSWQFAEIELSDSIIGAMQLRFASTGSNSSFGDIAIGDVALFGMHPIPLQEQLYFPDRDRDGYGNGDTAIFYCGMIAPDTLSNIDGDCNDRHPAIFPNARDTVCNGIDEDCNGVDNLAGAEPLEISIDSLKHPTCPKTNDGYIAIGISGGVPPYSIRWSSGDSLFQVNNIPSGEYTVEITDSSKCQRTSKTISLETANPVQFSFNILERPSCPSPSFGKVNVMLSGGVPPYEIFWSNGEKGAQADSLPAGNFFVTIIDKMGCTYESSQQIISSRQSYPLDIIEVIPVACPGDSNGVLRVVAPGSEPPLKIQWNTGDTSTQIAGLSSGFYSVTVTDANACRLQYDSFFLENPSAMEIGELVIDPERCAGEKSGSLRVRVGGGHPPLSYRWLTPDSTIITGPILSNISAGLYSLTVTDGLGCSFTKDSIKVDNQIPVILDSLHIQETTCPLSRDGEISFKVIGGNTPYQINWSDGMSQSTDRTSLNPGFYGLTITDALDCKYTFSDLNVPAGNGRLTLDLTVTDSLFCGRRDSAIIKASIFNGSPPYQYNWSAGVLHTSSVTMDTLVLFQAGTYSLTVTDGIGCVGRTDKLRLDSLAPIHIEEIVQVDNICPGGESGEIFVLANSPLGEINYLWSDGSTQSSLDSLTAGRYQLTISDESECKARALEFEIRSPDSLIIYIDTFIMEGRPCFELDSIQGGTAPYSYFWQNGNFTTDSTIYCLSESNNKDLTLEIVDDRWCQYSKLIYESTSQTEPSFGNGIDIYPNPFDQFFYVKNVFTEQIQARIINMKGQIMYQNSLEKGIHQIQIQNIPSGMYIINIELASGQKLHSKLIKQ